MFRRHSPPLLERIFRGIGHIMFPIGATWGITVALPESVSIAADPVQLAIWGVFMGSGAIAALAAWRGLYLIEYAVIPFMLGGILIYIAAIFNVVVNWENPGSGLALFLMSALASYITARWCSLNVLLDGPLRLLFKRRRGADE